MSPNGILHNAATMEINLNVIQAIILSHGHVDHTMGLPNLIDKSDSPQIPLICHPDALLDRKLIMQGGYEGKPNNVGTTLVLQTDN